MVPDRSKNTPSRSSYFGLGSQEEKGREGESEREGAQTVQSPKELETLWSGCMEEESCEQLWGGGIRAAGGGEAERGGQLSRSFF